MKRLAFLFMTLALASLTACPSDTAGGGGTDNGYDPGPSVTCSVSGTWIFGMALSGGSCTALPVVASSST